MNSDRPGKPRRLSVRHTTHYTYDRMVTRSSHRLHLCPVVDNRQRVLNYKLEVSTPVDVIDYEDVFGNRTERFDIVTPYNQLTICAKSIVEISDFDPFAFVTIPIRPAYPLVWMPWERVMLSPYLTPVELPDTQLQEITEYAMSFVNRNEQDLMEALFAINLEI